MELTRKGYEKKVEGHLKQWAGRLNTLQARAEMAGEQTKKELLSDLSAFRKLEVEGQAHLGVVQKEASAAWEEVRADLADKWNHLSGAADAIWARLK
jgi:hypothetical protein